MKQKIVIIVSAMTLIGAAAVYANGWRCVHCKGTGFNGNVNCFACKGTGRINY